MFSFPQEMVIQPAVLFALLSMTLVGVADFVYKRAALAGAVPSSFLLIQSWFFGATALLFRNNWGQVLPFDFS